LYEELRTFDTLVRDANPLGLYGAYDQGTFDFAPGEHVITDDHPLVEYWEVAREVVGAE
jgi:hypothetical protein